MKASEKAYQFIRKWEGLLLTARNDMVGVRTIGYGHTGKDVTRAMRITKDGAEKLLHSDISRMENYVNATMIHFNQSQFDALVSFTFNLGPGNLRTLVHNRGKTEIGNAMRLYCHAGGVKVRGLVRRREAETQMYFSEESVNYFTPCSKKCNTLWEGLHSLKIPADFESREKIAKRNIVGAYEGSAEQNIRLLNLLKKGKLIKTDDFSEDSVNYFTPCSKKCNTLWEGLHSLKIPADFQFREKIAKVNNIEHYCGSAEQNNKMLGLLKKGKLVRP